MSIQGPGPHPFPLPALIPAKPLPAGRPAASRTPASPARGDAAPVEASAPPGSLWAVLTEEERSFFAQQASLGTLSYGRGRAPAASSRTDAPLGQRIDVRG